MSVSPKYGVVRTPCKDATSQHREAEGAARLVCGGARLSLVLSWPAPAGMSSFGSSMVVMLCFGFAVCLPSGCFVASAVTLPMVTSSIHAPCGHGKAGQGEEQSCHGQQARRAEVGAALLTAQDEGCDAQGAAGVAREEAKGAQALPFGHEHAQSARHLGGGIEGARGQRDRSRDDRQGREGLRGRGEQSQAGGALVAQLGRRLGRRQLQARQEGGFRCAEAETNGVYLATEASGGRGLPILRGDDQVEEDRPFAPGAGLRVGDPKDGGGVDKGWPCSKAWAQGQRRVRASRDLAADLYGDGECGERGDGCCEGERGPLARGDQEGWRDRSEVACLRAGCEGQSAQVLANVSERFPEARGAAAQACDHHREAAPATCRGSCTDDRDSDAARHERVHR
mmetsp:Transcript_24927/g.53831  ORF Transcript_24927/g.53831 Transcript_24927/m.53831 type:complete len:397 (-) Transcript_24927:6-1196(-)